MTESAVKSIWEKINEAKEVYDTLVDSVTDVDKAQLFKSIFEKYPMVSSISWRQGTPSFNDGEPCTFSVHEPSVVFSFLEPGETEPTECECETYELDGWLSYDAKNRPAWATSEFFEAADAVADAHGAIPEDVMHHVFGDGVQIEVDARGITVEDVYFE